MDQRLQIRRLQEHAAKQAKLLVAQKNHIDTLNGLNLELCAGLCTYAFLAGAYQPSTVTDYSEESQGSPSLIDDVA